MQRTLAFAVILTLGYMPAGQAAGPLLASALRAADRFDLAGARTEQHVRLLGEGAAVKVKLATGETLEGVVSNIDADGFDLVTTRVRVLRRIDYPAVAELRFARTTYRAAGRPDVTEAGRVAAGLVGRHVAVEVAGRSTYRGHVQNATAEHLVLQLDRVGTLLEVAYADIDELGPNLSRGAKAGLWTTGVVVGLTIILTLMEGAEEPDI